MYPTQKYREPDAVFYALGVYALAMIAILSAVGAMVMVTVL